MILLSRSNGSVPDHATCENLEGRRGSLQSAAQPIPLLSTEQRRTIGVERRGFGRGESARVQQEDFNAAPTETGMDAHPSVAEGRVRSVLEERASGVLFAGQIPIRVVATEVVIVPHRVQRTVPEQAPKIGNGSEFGIPSTLHREVGGVDVGRVAQQDDRMGIEGGHLSPYGG